ncbi:MAG TPA: hypothetical protein VFH59_10690 [Frateuria sp.]|uniref:hypothetical protein n=1 Tax=Frateuria sp. TaxID=2211372 RepID=UPI002D811514|nr:hypothetical protein [Frateuria sp.]HET6805893.1 hypothetical protein [Frateuria sp.]
MRQAMILHPGFVRARAALLKALDTDEEGQLIFVIGLSGAGKSEVRYAVMPIFAGDPETWPKGGLPAISVRAAPTDRSNFSSKEFASRLYLEILEPNLGWLARRGSVEDADQGHTHADARLESPFWKGLRSHLTEHRLRACFERMAVARGLRAVFVEEATSMTHTQSGKDPRDHMVNCMCLAEEIKATMVFFGVPRMAALWQGNAEIRRRAHFVFVDRYRIQEKSDRPAFGRLAVSLASRYQFSRADLLVKNLDLAYAASAGVCGELKGYLRRADDLRASEGHHAIHKRHLENAIYPPEELDTLHRDVEAFDGLKASTPWSTTRRFFKHAR